MQTGAMTTVSSTVALERPGEPLYISVKQPDRYSSLLSVSYEIYWFKSGTFVRLGDGGYINVRLSLGL